jgi:tRNA-uridine aminocarboxypropyltransferase
MHRSLCICALVPRIVTRTRVALILHQLEQRKTTNTGRLAARCLVNSIVTGRGSELDVGDVGDVGSTSPWQAEGTEPVLLFPYAHARPLAAWRDSPRPITLVVPDGTWRQANKARRRIKGLAALPCATLPAGTRSRYRLRDDTRAGGLATIEAVAVALGILEGPEVQAALEHIFQVMVDRTLWTNGRIPSAQVTGGIPPGIRPHDPSGERPFGDRCGRC